MAKNANDAGIGKPTLVPIQSIQLFALVVSKQWKLSPLHDDSSVDFRSLLADCPSPVEPRPELPRVIVSHRESVGTGRCFSDAIPVYPVAGSFDDVSPARFTIHIQIGPSILTQLRRLETQVRDERHRAGGAG